MVHLHGRGHRGNHKDTTLTRLETMRKHGKDDDDDHDDGYGDDYDDDSDDDEEEEVEDEKEEKTMTLWSTITWLSMAAVPRGSAVCS